MRLARSITSSATRVWLSATQRSTVGHDLALDGALHVGDFLGALVHQQADYVHLGVVDGDGLADLLEDGGLAGLGRRDDEATLALAHGRHDVDGAPGDGILAVLHLERLVGINRREVGKLGADLDLLGVEAVDRTDLGERRILVVGAGGAHRALDVVAGTQAGGADEVGGNEGVVATRHVPVHAQVAKALIAELEHALYVAEALGASVGVVDLLHELGLLLAGGVNLELARPSREARRPSWPRDPRARGSARWAHRSGCCAACRLRCWRLSRRSLWPAPAFSEPACEPCAACVRRLARRCPAPSWAGLPSSAEAGSRWDSGASVLAEASRSVRFFRRLSSAACSALAAFGAAGRVPGEHPPRALAQPGLRRECAPTRQNPAAWHHPRPDSRWPPAERAQQREPQQRARSAST